MALKRRPRAGERGAALFIVVLIVTLLTAIGVFAAHVTSLAEVASGFVRRSASAFYLAEFGLNSVTSDMAGKEGDYDAFATQQNPPESCRANAGLPALLPAGTVVTCHVIDPDAMSKFVPVAISSDPEGPLYGALGRDASMQGTVRVELTDVFQGKDPQQGMPLAGSGVAMKPRSATVTITGGLLPVVPGATNRCNTDTTRASENVSLRAFINYTVP